MTDLSKLGIGLTVAFVLSFVALVTELCYIFFRRRKRVLDEESDDISSNSWSSKEIFYFFCCRNKSGIELTGAPTTVHPVDDDNVNVMEQPDDELAKWQELHGPSRILYTIKEEEREDLESEKSSSERKSKKRVCSSSIEEEKDISMVVSDTDRETETPYLTPCGSPPYCTPMSSPPRPRDRNLMYYLESENCYVLEVEKSQRRSISLSSEKCFPVVGKSNSRGS